MSNTVVRFSHVFVLSFSLAYGRISMQITDFTSFSSLADSLFPENMIDFLVQSLGCFTG